MTGAPSSKGCQNLARAAQVDRFFSSKNLAQLLAHGGDLMHFGSCGNGEVGGVKLHVAFDDTDSG
jgi:hypothetical protein